MSVTYSNFIERIYRQLSDTDQASFPDDLVYDAVLAAHDAILPWVPKYKNVTLTTGSDPDLFELPNDVYDIQAVRVLDSDNSGKFISQATLAAGTARGYTTAENDWIESPKGYLSLSYNLTSGTNIEVHYLAYWDKPASSSDNSFVLTVPEMAHQGMIYYAMSIILAQVIVDTGILGPYKTKVDSGHPEHNPMKDIANWFRNLFIQEMKMMPPYQKAMA